MLEPDSPTKGSTKAASPFVEVAEGRLPLWVGLAGAQASSNKQTSKQAAWPLQNLSQILAPHLPLRIYHLLRSLNGISSAPMVCELVWKQIFNFPENIRLGRHNNTFL